MNNVREYIYQSGTAGAINLTFAAGTNTYTTVHPIMGTIKSFEWKTNTTGSLFLFTSGTGFLVHSTVAPSGASWQKLRPAELYSTGSPYSVAEFFVNDRLVLGISGAGASQSGTFIVRYC